MAYTVGREHERPELVVTRTEGAGAGEKVVAPLAVMAELGFTERSLLRSGYENLLSAGYWKA